VPQRLLPTPLLLCIWGWGFGGRLGVFCLSDQWPPPFLSWLRLAPLFPPTPVSPFAFSSNTLPFAFYPIEVVDSFATGTLLVFDCPRGNSFFSFFLPPWKVGTFNSRRPVLLFGVGKTVINWVWSRSAFRYFNQTQFLKTKNNSFSFFHGLPPVQGWFQIFRSPLKSLFGFFLPKTPSVFCLPFFYPGPFSLWNKKGEETRGGGGGWTWLCCFSPRSFSRGELFLLKLWSPPNWFPYLMAVFSPPFEVPLFSLADNLIGLIPPNPTPHFLFSLRVDFHLIEDFFFSFFSKTRRYSPVWFHLFLMEPSFCFGLIMATFYFFLILIFPPLLLCSI